MTRELKHSSKITQHEEAKARSNSGHHFCRGRGVVPPKMLML